jgi:hypothetical protein
VADPVSTQITSGDSTTATTNVGFSAQATGTLLTLHVASDDYKTGNPAGWTVAEEVGSAEGSFHGSYFWFKISDGTETSVSYTIGSASKSSYLLVGHTNISSASPKDVSAKQNTNTGPSAPSNYTTPTSPTTSAGRKFALGHIVMHGTVAAFLDFNTWLSSYTEVGQLLGAGASPWYGIGLGGLAFDGGGTTSTGATSNQDSISRSGIIAVFNVSAVGGAVISSPTPSGEIASATSATVGCTTDTSSGTLYVVVDTAANLAGVTAAQIKLGQKASGGAAAFSDNVAVTDTTPDVAISGLTGSTTYAYAIVQNDGTNDSNVLTGTFTTSGWNLTGTGPRLH